MAYHLSVSTDHSVVCQSFHKSGPQKRAVALLIYHKKLLIYSPRFTSKLIYISVCKFSGKSLTSASISFDLYRC